MALPVLVAITGPTGSGKSDLALALARSFEGEVVNYDSVQLYRYFNIGSAKLPVSERCGIPHHLIDVLDPEEVSSAGDYARAARVVLDELSGRAALPVFAGGTGFYLSALLQGLFSGPPRDQALRDRLTARESRHSGFLHRLLSRRDPASAARIHPKDTQKLVRAVEISVLGKRPPSEQFTSGRNALKGYRVIQIGLNPPRSVLYESINRRSERMFAEGLLDEVRAILALGYSGSAKPFESVGYRQALDHVEGRTSLAEAIASTQLHTRRYAKRQWTWFRRDPSVHWLDGFGNSATVQSEAADLIRGRVE